MTKCKDCIELTRQLREAWEKILRMDDELKQISELVRQIEPCARCGVQPGERHLIGCLELKGL